MLPLWAWEVHHLVPISQNLAMASWNPHLEVTFLGHKDLDVIDDPGNIAQEAEET